jgi:hypothetical protein
MTSFGRALLFGFLVWLVPFGVAFAIFPLKESWRSLFESIMPVVVAAVTVLLALRYLRRVRSGFFREGLLLGLLWLVVCVVIDLPLMLSPPINMDLVEYLADVGLTYLLIPIITTGLGAARAIT